jgi:hypothetical protein
MLEPGSKTMSVRTHQFEFLGNKFSVNSVRFPRSSAENRRQIEMYHYVAATLAPGFEYVSPARIQAARDRDRIDSELFNAGDFPLSKLEYLKQTDIFDGNDWISERPDLLDVYPYYYHLIHFIGSFREDYHTKRTRL